MILTVFIDPRTIFRVGAHPAERSRLETPDSTKPLPLPREMSSTKPLSRTSSTFKSRFLGKEKGAEKETPERARSDQHSAARTASKRFLDTVRGKKDEGLVGFPSVVRLFVCLFAFFFLSF